MHRRYLLPVACFLSLFLLLAVSRLSSDAGQEKNLLRITKDYQLLNLYDETDSTRWQLRYSEPMHDWRDTVNSMVFRFSYHRNRRLSKRVWPHREKDPLAKNNPHSGVIHRLWIKDLDAFLIKNRQPQGQVIVFESWSCREMPGDSVPMTTLPLARFYPLEHWFTPLKPQQLHIMYKDNRDPRAAEGWVYGVVDIHNGISTPEVMQSGKVNSCISCHRQADDDFVFGRWHHRGVY